MDEFLSQHRPQGHDHASDDLSGGRARIDGSADVVSGYVVHNANTAGGLIDLHLSAVGTERVAG